MKIINLNKLCIAISGQSGCGNTSVCTLLSQKIGIPFINYTFRTLAQEQNIDFQTIRDRAEQEDKWDIMVDTKQVEMAKNISCIVGSRLAIWMIKDADLKVYLCADESVRVQRIMERENLSDYDTTLADTHNRDKLDHERYLRSYQIDNKNYTTYADLIIDVSSIAVEQVCDKILEQLQFLKYVSAP